MSVEKFWKELTFRSTEWTYLALTMLCQLHRNQESKVMVWRLNQVHSNREPVGMGPVVDRDLPGFQQYELSHTQQYRLFLTHNNCKCDGNPGSGGNIKRGASSDGIDTCIAMLKQQSQLNLLDDNHSLELNDESNNTEKESSKYTNPAMACQHTNISEREKKTEIEKGRVHS